MGRRIGFALLGLLATMTLFAEGLLDHPWISWFLPFRDTVLARPKLVLLLMVPVVGYLLGARVSLFRNLLAVVAISCVTVSGFDLLLRIFGFTIAGQIPPIRLPEFPWLERSAPNREVQGSTYGDLAGIARDSALREPRPYRSRTDARGFRNDHPGTDIDLVILGDSFGAGQGTTQDSIFSSRLERQSGQRVYNLSYPGGPRREYLNLLAELPHLTVRPDARVVWVLFTGNDLSDADPDVSDSTPVPWWRGLKAARIRYQNYRTLSPLRMAFLERFGRLLTDEVSEQAIVRQLPDGRPILFREWYRHDVNLTREEAEQHSNFPKIERVMGAMRRLTAERGLALTVIIIPAKEEIYRWILEDRERRPSDLEDSGFGSALLAACDRTGIRCLNPKPVLTAEAYGAFDGSGQLVYWRDDTHLNDRGNEIIADFIAARVLGRSTVTDSTASGPGG